MASRAEHDQSAGVGRRGSQRARLHLAAVLECTTRKHRVLIRNLSAKGAMLQGTALPEPGRLVMLKRHELDLLGTVVWKSDDRCGVHFDEPLDREQVIELARAAPEPMDLDPLRYYQLPGVDEQRISADDWVRSRLHVARHLRSFS